MLFPDFKAALATHPGNTDASTAFTHTPGKSTPFANHDGGKVKKQQGLANKLASLDPGQATLGALLGLILGRVADSTLSGYAQPVRDAAIGAAVAATFEHADPPPPETPAHWKPL